MLSLLCTSQLCYILTHTHTQKGSLLEVLFDVRIRIFSSSQPGLNCISEGSEYTHTHTLYFCISFLTGCLLDYYKYHCEFMCLHVSIRSLYVASVVFVYRVRRHAQKCLVVSLEMMTHIHQRFITISL